MKILKVFFFSQIKTNSKCKDFYEIVLDTKTAAKNLVSYIPLLVYSNRNSQVTVSCLVQ